jgi:predicted nucleotidyltransferase
MAITQSQIKRIVALAKAYGATRLILFGSAMERPREAKDIDLACEGITGWKLYELSARLEEELKISMDIIPLNPPTRFTKHIEARGKALL